MLKGSMRVFLYCKNSCNNLKHVKENFEKLLCNQKLSKAQIENFPLSFGGSRTAVLCNSICIQTNWNKSWSRIIRSKETENRSMPYLMKLKRAAMRNGSKLQSFRIYNKNSFLIVGLRRKTNIFPAFSCAFFAWVFE